MDLSRIILGPVITEKSERLKSLGDTKAYMLRVAPDATKTDVKRALKEFYDLTVTDVRMLWVRPKHRAFGKSQMMEKRHAAKRAIIRLAAKSKPLDLTSFKTS